MTETSCPRRAASMARLAMMAALPPAVDSITWQIRKRAFPCRRRSVYADPMPMKEATSPFAGCRAVIWLFAIGLVTIPFDSVRGLNALGELGFELSFPFFAAAIAAALWTDVRHGDSRILSSLSLRVA